MREIYPDGDEGGIEHLKDALYSRERSDQVGERERRVLEQEHTVVPEDWGEEAAPTNPQPKRSILAAPSQKNFNPRIIVRAAFLLAGLFFLAAVGYFSYHFFVSGVSVSPGARNIDIVISGPSQVSGGEPTVLQIIVTNNNTSNLELADLVIAYPSGTRSPTDFVTELGEQRISLGTIEPGGQRRGTVTAVFASGEKNAIVEATLEYRLGVSHALFATKAEYAISFGSSPVTISVEGNTEVISGQEVEFVVTVSNNAITPVRDILVEAAYPFGFTAISGERDIRNELFPVGDLAPGEKKRLVIQGTLLGEASSERIFRFSAGTRASREEEGITNELAKTDARVMVSESFLQLAFSVNGSSEVVVVEPGSQVSLALSWANNLGVPIEDAVLAVRLAGIPIDGSTVTVPDGFFRSSDNVFIWDKSTTRGSLARLDPNARGSFVFSFRVPSSEELKDARDPQLVLTLNASGKRSLERGVPENLQSVMTRRIAVASDLTLTAAGLHRASPFTVRGPLPPTVGSETSYAILFTITNTTNSIENARLTALLPPYVRWDGVYKPASEKITFTQRDGSLVWDIGTIEPGVGSEGAPRQIVFSVGFIPSSSQIGEEAVLLQDIRLTGLDAAGSEVERTVSDITTQLTSDPGFSSTEATVIR
jgi:hypothetical protein